MMGVTRALLSEYESNRYAAYPLGYYKAITLSYDEQKRVLEILCKITGLRFTVLPRNDDYLFWHV